MITINEIKTAVGENPALLTEISTNFESEIMTSLRGKGIILRTQQEEDSFLTSHLQKQDVRDKIVAPVVKEIHDQYDEQLFKLTGERRKPDEKTYEFLSRKIGEIKNEKISDPVLKSQLESLQGQIKTMETDHKTKIETMTTDFFNKEVSMDLKSALDIVVINIPAHIKTDEEKQKFVSMQKEMIKSDFLRSKTPKKDNEGNIVYFEGEKPLTNITDGKPLSALDLIKTNYSFYLSPDKRTQSGAGGGNGGNGDKLTFATKEEVANYIKTSGMDPLSFAGQQQYEKLCKESGLIK